MSGKTKQASSSALLPTVAASAADRGDGVPTVDPLFAVAATLAGRLLGCSAKRRTSGTPRPDARRAEAGIRSGIGQL